MRGLERLAALAPRTSGPSSLPDDEVTLTPTIR
jgi:hypothetical protein